MIAGSITASSFDSSASPTNSVAANERRSMAATAAITAAATSKSAVRPLIHKSDMLMP